MAKEVYPDSALTSRQKEEEGEEEVRRERREEQAVKAPLPMVAGEEWLQPTAVTEEEAPRVRYLRLVNV